MMFRMMAIAILTVAAAMGGRVDAAPVAWQQKPNTWVKRHPLENTPPSPRLGYEGACAWDTANDVLIRYSGHNQGGGGEQNSELWTYDPTSGQWDLKESNWAPPGVCCEQQNVFDPVWARYIRFPSFSGSHGWQWWREIYLNDSTVWTWDPADNLWRNHRPVPAPHVSPLRCASWDSDAQVVVMFGGEGNHEGTRVYDPYTNTWTKMNPPREPDDRSGGNMVYDSANRLHILFGAQFTDDPHTWAYDLRRNEWRDLAPPAMPPTNKNDAVMAYDSLNRVIVAIVRVQEDEKDDSVARLETWTFDVAANRWTKMNPPQEPDRSGSRARVLSYAPELGLTILENCTQPSHGGLREQQIWTYCSKPKAESNSESLRPTEDVRLEVGEEGVRIRWKPVASNKIDGYNIYRGTGEPPWIVNYQKIGRWDYKIGTIDGHQTAFLDRNVKPGTLYTYFVRTEARGKESPDSRKVRTQPRIVENIVVSVLSPKRVEVSWKAPEGDDIAGYRIERAPVEVWSEDQLVRLKQRTTPLEKPSVGAIRRIGEFERLNDAPLSAMQYEDKVDLAEPVAVGEESIYDSRMHSSHLDSGGKPYRYGVYAYRVRAVNALGVESGPSPYVLTIPSAPQWPYSREDGNTCELKWEANPEKNLQGYRVYRLDGRWDKDPLTRLTPDPIEATEFADTTAGEPTRRYHIVAVDALGQEGFPSRPVWFDREWKRFYEPFTGEWHQ